MIFASFALAAQTALTPSLEASIHRYLAEKVRARETVGVSVSVVRNGKTICLASEGSRDLDVNSKVDSQTCFRTMSIGKQFTAAGVLLLVQGGRVKLGTPISAYLPSLPASWSRVTVAELLAHSSGIRSYHEIPGFGKLLGKDITPRDLLTPVYRLPLDFEPGTKEKYSNSDYFLLGMLIERLSGEEFGQYLRRRLFVPLGMSRTHLERPHEAIRDLAYGFLDSGGKFTRSPYVSPNVIWAAGGFVTTAGDLATWYEGLHRGKLLNRQLAKTMEQPFRPQGSYGFGSELGSFHGHPTAGHQGGGIGYNTDYLDLPSDRLAVIVLCNSTRAPSEEIARHIAGVCLPALSDSGKTVADPNSAVTARVKRVLENAAVGKADENDFSPSAEKGFLDFVRSAGPKMLGPMGRLTQLELMEFRQGFRRYRARYEKGQLIWEIRFDGKQLIVSMEPSKE